MSLLLVTVCVASHTFPLIIKWPAGVTAAQWWRLPVPVWRWQAPPSGRWLGYSRSGRRPPPLGRDSPWRNRGPAPQHRRWGGRMRSGEQGARRWGLSPGPPGWCPGFNHGPEGPVIDVPSQGSCVELPRPCLQEPGGDLWPFVLSSHIHAIRQFHWSGWTFLLLWLSV